MGKKPPFVGADVLMDASNDPRLGLGETHPGGERTLTNQARRSDSDNGWF